MILSSFKKLKFLFSTLQMWLGFSALYRCDWSNHLRANQQKSQIYTVGVSDEVKYQILVHTVFLLGQFSVTYLVIPVYIRKGNASDCNALVEKIVKKKWVHMRLPYYTFRLQWINSILFLWNIRHISMFMLPQSVIKSIENVCTNILWHHSSEYHALLIACKWICRPTKSGSLGIKVADCGIKQLLGSICGRSLLTGDARG